MAQEDAFDPSAQPPLFFTHSKYPERVLKSLLFGVSVSDPFTYAAVAVMLLGTVTLATLIPALRAAKIDPLIALRR